MNSFPGIPVKIYKILRKVVDFQLYSLSISYRISNVLHGGVRIFSGIAHSILCIKVTSNFSDFKIHVKLQNFPAAVRQWSWFSTG